MQTNPHVLGACRAFASGVMSESQARLYQDTLRSCIFATIPT